MVTMRATLDEVSPWTSNQHDIDTAKVDAIVAAVDGGRWTLPPILVIEDEGNGATILDGHHRAAAAREIQRRPGGDWLQRIPAYVVTVADYRAVLDTHFGGDSPARLADLDDYIIVDGAPYTRPE